MTSTARDVHGRGTVPAHRPAPGSAVPRAAPTRAGAAGPRAPSTSSARPLPTSPSSWSTSRPPAGRPADVRASPRSARSRCGAARCSASSPRWSTRASPSRRSSPRSPASPTRWSPSPRASSTVLPAFLEFGPGLRAGRPQRRLRRRLPQGRRRARCGIALAGARGARHRPAGPPRGHARRGAQPQAVARWRALFGGRRPPEPPRAARTRGPPSTSCTACSAGSATSASRRWRSSATYTRACRPPSAASATWPRRCRTRRASTSSTGRAARCCTSARRVDLRTRVRTLLHGVRDPHPDGEMVQHRRLGHADRLRDTARGAGARAAPDRRAQAALQPALAPPGAGAVGQATVEPFPRLSIVRAVRPTRRRRRLPRSVRTPRARPNRRSPRCTRPSRCASAAAGCRRVRRRPRATACSPRSGAAVPPAPVGRTPGRTVAIVATGREPP